MTRRSTTRRNHSGRNAAMLMGGLAAGILGGRIIPPIVGAAIGFGRVRAGGDPFAQLIADHRRIRSLLDEMAAAPLESKAYRARLFLALKRTLAKHAMAEEDVVYPLAVQQPETGEQNKRLYDEHADMKIHLYEMEKRLMSGEDWSTSVLPLRELALRHFEDEETRVFPELRRRLGTEKLPKISGQISREEALVV